MPSILSIFLAASAMVVANLALADDPDLIGRGQDIFEAKCLVCHRLEPGVHRIGPSLAGMFARPAGTAPGFRRYSRGLAGSGFMWDDAKLDAYLLDAGAVIKDNRMIFAGLQNPDDRAAIIAYMRHVTAEE